MALVIQSQMIRETDIRRLLLLDVFGSTKINSTHWSLPIRDIHPDHTMDVLKTIETYTFSTVWYQKDGF